MILPEDKTQPRQIGLLGGSFNPAHEGHREISIAALERLALDAVWWLVSPGNPLKDPEDYAPYDERLAYSRNVADHPNIIISDFERRHQLQYTVDTLNALKGAYEDVRFVWIMGADSLAGFHKWRDWRVIADSVPIAVFSRPGSEDASARSEAAIALSDFQRPPADAKLLAASPAPAWIFFTETANPISSTKLRHQQKMEGKDLD